jgi:hypothetical protein
LSQSREGPDLQGALNFFETMPSRPMMQACRKMVAPSSSVWSLRTMPNLRWPTSLANRFLRSPSSGRSRRSWPASSRRSKAYSTASLTVPRRWSASNTATPSGPYTTASPSSVNDRARNRVAVTAIAGYRVLQS